MKFIKWQNEYNRRRSPVLPPQRGGPLYGKGGVPLTGRGGGPLRRDKKGGIVCLFRIK